MSVDGPTSSSVNDPTVWAKNFFQFANCPSQPPKPESIHPNVRIPYKSFFVQLKALEPEGPCAYFSMMDDVQWTLYSFTMRWLEGEYRERRLMKFTSIEWVVVNTIVGARVVKHIGTGTISFVRAVVSHVDMSAMKISLFDLDDATTYDITVKDLFHMPREAMAVPFGMCRARIDKTQLFEGTGLIYKACLSYGIKIDTIFQASRLRPSPMNQVGLVCELACPDAGGFYSELTLQVWTKERVNLGDIIVSKIAEMTRIPDPEDILFQEVIVTHVEPTGDFYYTLKANQNNHIQPIQDILEELDTIIRNKIPRVRAQFPNSFNVDEVLDRLNGNLNEIFVIPYLKDHLYYRARLMGTIGQDKGLVRFVDYGNTQIVDLVDIILLDHFDKALSLIPPQCRHARIAGVERFTPAMDCILQACDSSLKIRKASTWDVNDAVEGYPVIAGQPLISLRVLLAEFGRAFQSVNHAPAA